MKYGIIVGGRVTEPVFIPRINEADPESWLALQFPTLSGWVPVSEDAVPGTIANGDGTFSNPTNTKQTPVVFDSADWKGYAYGVLGAIAAPAGNELEQLAAGMRRYGAILKVARASTDEGTIAALDQYDDATNYRKDKVVIFLGFLNADNKIVTDAEFEAIVGSWPNG